MHSSDNFYNFIVKSIQISKKTQRKIYTETASLRYGEFLTGRTILNSNSNSKKIIQEMVVNTETSIITRNL